MYTNVVSPQLDDSDARSLGPVQLDEEDLRAIEAAIESLDHPVEDDHELKMGVHK